MSIIKLCLDCDHEIDLGPNPRLKQRLTCPHCKVTLEVIKLDPVELDWVYDGPKKNLGQFDDWWKASVQQ